MEDKKFPIKPCGDPNKKYFLMKVPKTFSKVFKNSESIQFDPTNDIFKLKYHNEKDQYDNTKSIGEYKYFIKGQPLKSRNHIFMLGQRQESTNIVPIQGIVELKLEHGNDSKIKLIEAQKDAMVRYINLKYIGVKPLD